MTKRQDAKDALKRAEAALTEAIEDKKKAEEQVSWRHRLQKGWERVHERNNLANLFTDDYRRIR